MNQQDLILYTLMGLQSSPEYKNLVITLIHYPYQLTFDQLRPKLLQHEQQLKLEAPSDESVS